MTKSRPTPATLGHAALSHKTGSVKRGADGKKWVVVKTKTGARWQPYTPAVTFAKRLKTGARQHQQAGGEPELVSVLKSAEKKRPPWTEVTPSIAARRKKQKTSSATRKTKSSKTLTTRSSALKTTKVGGKSKQHHYVARAGVSNNHKKPATTLTWDGYSWSDGKVLSWKVTKDPQVYDAQQENDEDKFSDMSTKYSTAEFVPPRDTAGGGKKGRKATGEPVTLEIRRAKGLLPVLVTLQQPVTAGEVIRAHKKVYRAAVSDRDWKVLEANDFIKNWDKRFFPTWKSMKEQLDTQGKLLGDHAFWEGLQQKRDGNGEFVVIFGS